mmetsp:Transcript_34055/g.67407  ORF Transcript_34055/g.67407 Transcript_34055/m.67407 type:complete len:104 (+) Transcript_34055:419-730(+)
MSLKRSLRICTDDEFKTDRDPSRSSFFFISSHTHTPRRGKKKKERKRTNIHTGVDHLANREEERERRKIRSQVRPFQANQNGMKKMPARSLIQNPRDERDRDR